MMGIDQFFFPLVFLSFLPDADLSRFFFPEADLSRFFFPEADLSRFFFSFLAEPFETERFFEAERSSLLFLLFSLSFLLASLLRFFDS